MSLFCPSGWLGVCMRFSVGSIALGLVLGGLLSLAAAVGVSLLRGSEFSTLLADPAWWGQALVPGCLAGLIVGGLPRRASGKTTPGLADSTPKLPGAGVPVRTSNPKRGGWLSKRLMFARLDEKGVLIHASPGLARRIGKRPASLQSASLTSLVVESHQPLVEKAIREAVRFGESRCVAQFPIATRETTDAPLPRRVLRMTLKLAPKKPGRPPVLRCIFQDATAEARLTRDKQRLERQFILAKRETDRYRQDLRGLKRSYHDLYHNAPIMYFSLDALGRLIGFNDTLVRVLGTPREELAMRFYREAFPVEPTTSDAPPFPLTRDKEEESETQWRRLDGAAIDVWIRSEAVYDSSGSFVRWRCSAIDLTERNRLARQLRNHTQELERTNARLRHINAELEDFTHVVSHDLKEPLRTLQAFSHILAEDYAGQLGPDGFEYINHLVQASRRLGVLIDDLLTLSQAGRMAKSWTEFDLIQAIATVRRDLADMIQRKDATVLTEGSLPTVVGDPQRIAQLLTNLVANGLKYNENPSPSVVVGAAVSSEPGFATIYVRDNGIGIDPKNNEQIFGIFRRLHPEGQYEGTGAGLAICKKIAEAHGGRIWVESVPGEGATFFFTLPLPKRLTDQPAPLPATTAIKPAKKSSPAKIENDGVNGVRLLMVEDLAEVGAIIVRLGERAGMKINWFLTAEEAWAQFQKEQPDFALLDMNLPGMDGVELCRKIRHELRWRGPIALFSQETPEAMELLKEAGANFFISKELLSRPSDWKESFHGIVKRSLTALPESPSVVAPEPAGSAQ